MTCVSTVPDCTALLVLEHALRLCTSKCWQIQQWLAKNAAQRLVHAKQPPLKGTEQDCCAARLRSGTLRTPAGSQQELQHAIQRDEQQLLLTPANTAWSRLHAHCMGKASCHIRQVPQTMLLAACMVPGYSENCVSPAVNMAYAMSAAGLRKQALQSHCPLHKPKAHQRPERISPRPRKSELKNTPQLPSPAARDR